jgi:Flp pilus assembly protein TadD
MLNNLGEAYRGTGDLAKAASCFRQAVRLAPRSPQSRNNLGLVLYAQGSLHEALAAFEQAVRLNPGYTKAHRNMGRVLQELGRLSEAMVSFERAKEVPALSQGGGPSTTAGSASDSHTWR